MNKPIFKPKRAHRKQAMPCAAALCFLLLSLLMHSSASYAAKRLAVLEFSSVGDTEQKLLTVLADKTRAGVLAASQGRIVDGEELVVMTRENIRSYLDQNGIGTQSCNESCEVELGRNIGVSYVMSGELVRLGPLYVLTVKMHETAEGKLLSTSGVETEEMKELLLGAQALGAEVLRKGLKASGASSADMGSKLEEKRCQEEAELKGAALRQAKLEIIEEEAQAEVSRSWREVSAVLEPCLALKKDARTPCVETLESWLDQAESIEVHLQAGSEVVETACGDRESVFEEVRKLVRPVDFVAAQDLLEDLIGHGEDVSSESPSIETAEALPLDNLSTKQVKFFKPQPKHLPQQPYYHKDFTAYTLEFTEVWLGPGFAKLGLTPHLRFGPFHTGVHVGSRPMLWAAGIVNYDAKWNLLRFGDAGSRYGFDVSASYNFMELSRSGDEIGLEMDYTGYGLMASVRTKADSTLHLGAEYATLGIGGTPDLSNINPILEPFLGSKAKQATESAQSALMDSSATEMFTGDLSLLTLSVNLDIRQNRRDSWIFQNSAVIWFDASTDSTIADELGVPSILGLDELVKVDESGPVSPVDSYIVSVARQWSGKRSDLRLGIGYSAFGPFPASMLPPVLKTVDWSYRLGGRSRRGESQLRRYWRSNKRDLRRGSDQRASVKRERREEKEATRAAAAAVQGPPLVFVSAFSGEAVDALRREMTDRSRASLEQRFDGAVGSAQGSEGRPDNCDMACRLAEARSAGATYMLTGHVHNWSGQRVLELSLYNAKTGAAIAATVVRGEDTSVLLAGLPIGVSDLADKIPQQ
jgi:hypothetical protein